MLTLGIIGGLALLGMACVAAAEALQWLAEREEQRQLERWVAGIKKGASNEHRT